MITITTMERTEGKNIFLGSRRFFSSGDWWWRYNSVYRPRMTLTVLLKHLLLLFRRLKIFAALECTALAVAADTDNEWKRMCVSTMDGAAANVMQRTAGVFERSWIYCLFIFISFHPFIARNPPIEFFIGFLLFPVMLPVLCWIFLFHLVFRSKT